MQTIQDQEGPKATVKRSPQLLHSPASLAGGTCPRQRKGPKVAVELCVVRGPLIQLLAIPPLSHAVALEVPRKPPRRSNS